MKRLLAGVIIGACLFIPITALASIPDADGDIHACRNTLLGGVRIINDATQNCNGLESPINWPATSHAPTMTLRDERILSFIDNQQFPVTLACEDNELAVGVSYAATISHGYAVPITSSVNGLSHWNLTLQAGPTPTQYYVAVNCLS